MVLDMNKNSRFASYRNIILFTLLAALMLTGVYRVIRWKDTTGNYISSYDELYHTPKNTIDVAFLGSSHCYAGIYPAVMWEDRGVTSFDMAVSGQDKDSCYHALIELLKTQKPKVVFADLYALTFEEHAFIGNVYRNLLSMRTSSNSVQLVTSYADKKDQEDFILRWPIVHTRYRELQPYDFLEYPLNDFGRGRSLRLGAHRRILDHTLHGYRPFCSALQQQPQMAGSDDPAFRKKGLPACLYDSPL